MTQILAHHPEKSETTDASESKRDVHQRSVRDDHETTESFGTCVFFLLCVCVCLFDERQERARALATDSFLSFYSSFELVASTLTRTCSPLGFTSSCGTFKRCRYAIQSKDCVFTRRLSRRRATFGEDPIEAIEAKLEDVKLLANENDEGNEIDDAETTKKSKKRRKIGNSGLNEDDLLEYDMNMLLDRDDPRRGADENLDTMSNMSEFNAAPSGSSRIWRQQPVLSPGRRGFAVGKKRRR